MLGVLSGPPVRWMGYVQRLPAARPKNARTSFRFDAAWWATASPLVTVVRRCATLAAVCRIGCRLLARVENRIEDPPGAVRAALSILHNQMPDNADVLYNACSCMHVAWSTIQQSRKRRCFPPHARARYNLSGGAGER